LKTFEDIPFHICGADTLPGSMKHYGLAASVAECLSRYAAISVSSCLTLKNNSKNNNIIITTTRWPKDVNETRESEIRRPMLGRKTLVLIGISV
jgi:hypothetical protein